MGNASSVREGGGEWQPQQQHNMREVEEGVYDRQGESQDLMGQSPPQSPRGVMETPLLFTPQTPMAPLQRPDELLPQDYAWIENQSEGEEFFCEQRIPTMITWSHGGKQVAVEGSWDNWKSKKWLQRSDKDFSIMQVLPSGFYQYRFIVDGQWRYSPDLPWIQDEAGNAYNILDLQDYIPDDIESIVGFEPPKSPESSYDNCPLDPEDFTKEPPTAPSHLNLTLLNSAPSPSNLAMLSKPRHVVLNHLYIQKPKSGQPVVALGHTHRFLAKYVTIVLFKSLQK